MRIFLHVGQPKSGTTAIQRALAQHSDTDPAPVLYYPKAGRLERKLVGHHNLAYELYDPAKYRAELGSWADMAAEVRALEPDRAGVITISSEALRPFLAKVVAAKLRKLLPDVPAQVGMYLRPQWEYVESGYVQLRRFAQTDLDLRGFWETTGRRIADYRATVEAWQAAMGAERVICLPFDAAVRRTGVVRDFLDKGLCIETDYDNRAQVNERMGLVAMSAVRHVRDAVRARLDRPVAIPGRTVMKLSQIFRDHPDERLSYSFMPPGLQDEIHAAALPSNRWLAERWPGFDSPAFLDRPAPDTRPFVAELPELGAAERARCQPIVDELVRRLAGTDETAKTTA